MFFRNRFTHRRHLAFFLKEVQISALFVTQKIFSFSVQSYLMLTVIHYWFSSKKKFNLYQIPREKLYPFKLFLGERQLPSLQLIHIVSPIERIVRNSVINFFIDMSDNNIGFSKLKKSHHFTEQPCGFRGNKVCE